MLGLFGLLEVDDFSYRVMKEDRRMGIKGNKGSRDGRGSISSRGNTGSRVSKSRSSRESRGTWVAKILQ